MKKSLAEFSLDYNLHDFFNELSLEAASLGIDLHPSDLNRHQNAWHSKVLVPLEPKNKGKISLRLEHRVSRGGVKYSLVTFYTFKDGGRSARISTYDLIKSEYESKHGAIQKSSSSSEDIQRRRSEAERRAREAKSKAEASDRLERQKRAATAEKAAALYSTLCALDEPTDYLASKGLEANVDRTLRLGSDDFGRFIAVQMLDVETNEFVNLQKIYDVQIPILATNKLFLKSGQKKGGAHWIDDKRLVGDGEDQIVGVCEGFATGASCYLTKHLDAVAVAFDAGNLKNVAKAIRRKHPKAVIVILADNDTKPGKRENVGLEAANYAARLSGAYVAVPTRENGKKCDWNDLYVEFGIDYISERLSPFSPKNWQKIPLSSINISDIPKNLVERKAPHWYSLEEATETMNRTARQWASYGESHIVKISAGVGKTHAAIVAALDEIKSLHNHDIKKTFEFYVPNLNLAGELYNRIQSVADKNNQYVSTLIFRGRGATNPSGNGEEKMCFRSQSVIDSARLPYIDYYKTFCREDEDGECVAKCQHYERCIKSGYLSQFGSWDIESGDLTPVEYDVIIKQHATLGLPRSEFERQQGGTIKAICIDESYYSSLIKISDIELDDFTKVLSDTEDQGAALLASVFVDLLSFIKKQTILRSSEKALILKTLKEEGIDGEEMDRINELVHIPKLNKIKASTLDDEAEIELEDFSKQLGNNPKVKQILSRLSEEIKTPRAETYGVTMSGEGLITVYASKRLERIMRYTEKMRDKIIELLDDLDAQYEMDFYDAADILGRDMDINERILDELDRAGVISRRPGRIKITSGWRDIFGSYKAKYMTIPTLIIDASASQGIIKQTLPEHAKDLIHAHEIHVKRNASVIQIDNSNASKASIGKQLKHYARLVATIAKENLGKSILIVSNKLITEDSKFMKEIGDEMNSLGILERTLDAGLNIRHFGAIRGIDQYKNYDIAIVMGRNQPAVEGVEGVARALYADVEDEPQFIGEQMLPTVPTQYLTKDHSLQWHDTPTHPDGRCQEILEQIREEETSQAIDRLRLVREGEGQDRTIFLLSAIPLPAVEVDRVVTARELLGEDMAANYAKFCFGGGGMGVMPLNSSVAFSTGKGIFKNETQAKNMFDRNNLRVHQNSIYILYRAALAGMGVTLSKIHYRLKGHGGSAMQALTIRNVEQTLAWLKREHGCDVVLVDVETIYETPVDIAAALGLVGDGAAGFGTGGRGGRVEVMMDGGGAGGYGTLRLDEDGGEARFWFDRVIRQRERRCVDLA